MQQRGGEIRMQNRFVDWRTALVVGGSVDGSAAEARSGQHDPNREKTQAGTVVLRDFCCPREHDTSPNRFTYAGRIRRHASFVLKTFQNEILQ